MLTATASATATASSARATVTASSATEMRTAVRRRTVTLVNSVEMTVMYTSANAFHIYASIQILRQSEVQGSKSLLNFIAYTHNYAPGENIQKVFGIFIEHKLNPGQFRF